MSEKPQVTVEFTPFLLPNFLRAPIFGEIRSVPVGVLTDEQAAAYWDWMREHWLEHVRKRREDE